MEIFQNMTTIQAEHKISNLGFHNLTDYEMPALRNLLGLNLKFCPMPSYGNRASLYARLETCLSNFHRKIRLLFQFRHKRNLDFVRSIYVPNRSYIPTKAPNNVEKLLELQVKNLHCLSQVRQFRKDNLTKNQRKTLTFLKFSEKFRIINSDKNLGPCLITNAAYLEMAVNHLGQNEVYVKIHRIPMDAIARRTHKLLGRLQIFYNNDSYQRTLRIISESFKNPSYNHIHFLAKVHKDPITFRPIISSINGITTGLSKWLAYRLQDLLPLFPQILPNSSTIVDMLPILPRRAIGDLLVTMDAESLYTSIPIQAALNVFSQLLHTQEDKNLIIEGIRIVMGLNFFEFNGEYYKQLQGLAMGTPCAVIVANLYLAWHENKILKKFPSVQLYKRYIDDVFFIWRPIEEKPFELKHFIAKLHQIPGVKWNVNLSQVSLPFMDLQIYALDQKWTTKTYQKMLNLYLYTPRNSAHPPGVLKGLIFGLIKKFRLQNPNEADFLFIRKKFLERLLARGYTKHQLIPIFRQASKKFLQKHFLQEKSKNKYESLVLTLPYNPRTFNSLQVKSILKIQQLEKLLNQYDMENRIVIGYTRPKNLGQHLTRTKFSLENEASYTSDNVKYTMCNPNPNSVAISGENIVDR